MTPLKLYRVSLRRDTVTVEARDIHDAERQARRRPELEVEELTIVPDSRVWDRMRNVRWVK